ncbi:MAG TPA: hypothetical protein VMT99_03210 [Candidatus Paceibacterota bacterium]|nr:hypothetical protein [Candidatus Paceibacterota bacterium]
MAENLVKGDVYETAGDSTHHPVAQCRTLDGVLFRNAHRNVAFARYAARCHDDWRLDASTEAEGFYVIVSDGVRGIFVPRGTNRHAVAQAVRRRFGPGSALLRAPTCGTCRRSMLHEGGGCYYCPGCHELKGGIV